MRSEHRAPLIASVIVVLACAGVLTHAIRTDALGGFASRPFHVIAGHLVVPADKAVADPAPLVPPTPTATPAAPGSSAPSSGPSARPTAKHHPVRETRAPKPAHAHHVTHPPAVAPAAPTAPS